MFYMVTDSCTFHPGAPFFHDAYKGWSCCKKKCTDFTEFLNIKVCIWWISLIDEKLTAVPLFSVANMTKKGNNHSNEMLPSNWEQGNGVAAQICIT
jgi:hypothetical protein